ncbi:putative ribosomal protein eL39-like 5 [Anolis carolinensis]|uniref:60S ribosomal protein L39 n=1 Tax=Anolis carolinensis TaxID=28377 RepID=A0A803T7X3_ANOCA|nr:PREDICTED: putative 60S ribosomal protein L39-like 5 [Anolis carolinensis]|eukprot:XP_008114230.1 PREDICTED: putative 60S ribosomal protein L39-like 5 [Anolis carolinensis]
MSSHKTFNIKQFLAKKQWIWIKAHNQIRYNTKRRHWKRIKLSL